VAYATVAELAQALHIRGALGDDDRTMAEACLDAATVEVDTFIDWPRGPDDDRLLPGPPLADEWSPGEVALANRVTVLRGVEWWKANDAAFGIIGNAELGQLRAPRDGFARHAVTLLPLKRRYTVGAAGWGIA
jgi:hypothetical protein